MDCADAVVPLHVHMAGGWDDGGEGVQSRVRLGMGRWGNVRGGREQGLGVEESMYGGRQVGMCVLDLGCIFRDSWIVCGWVWTILTYIQNGSSLATY